MRQTNDGVDKTKKRTTSKTKCKQSANKQNKTMYNRENFTQNETIVLQFKKNAKKKENKE